MLTFASNFRYFGLLLFLFIASPVLAQWLPAVEVKVELADGEPYGASLNPLFMDRAGFLWLNRYGEGVGRYDGEIMTTYGEENGINCEVRSIIQDGQGYIWLGGAWKGTGTTSLLRSTVPFLGGEEPKDVLFTDSLPAVPLSDQEVTELKTDAKGQVWVSTYGLLLRYSYTNTGQLKADTILNSPRQKSVGCDFGPNNELFMVRGDSVLYTSTIDHQAGEDLVLTRLEGNANNGTKITLGSEGFFWLEAATYLERYKLPKDGLGNGPAVGKRLNYTVKGIGKLTFLDDETAIFSLPTGLLEIDIETMTVRKEYNHTTDLNIPGMQQILDDGRGNIWIGTITGLARMPTDYRAYASPNKKTMGPAEMPDNTNVQVARMGGPDGNWLLIGTTTGIFIRSETGEWQAVGKEQGLLLPNILGMAGDEDGRIWAASTAAGINLLSPPESVHPLSQRPSDLSILEQDYVVSGISINYMYSPFVLSLPGKDGEPDVLSLWGGNGFNGKVLTEQQPWLWLTETTGYTGGPITFFARNQQGHILTASQNGTLLRTTQPFTYEYYEQLYQNVETKRENLYYSTLDSTVFESIELKWDTATFPIVYGMAAIEDELWLGVETGALVLNLETLEAKAFIPMSCDLCQPKDFVYDPQRNRIWAASSRGIWEVDARNHRLLRMVTEENGLRGNTGFSPQCITLDSEGIIYYATSTGLAAYRPELARPLVDSFSVYIRERELQQDSWGKNEVVLGFAALDYRENKKVYQTKLEGYDEDWSETTKNATLRYTNLPAYLFPKTYQFRVRSLTDDGNWIENTVPAEITVSPPWYFRWWAALIGLGLLALAIRQYLRFQLRRQAEALALKEAAVIKEQRDEIKQKNDQNELLLKEIHHRVKNNLEVVSSLLELQSAGLSDSEARDAMQAGQSRVQSMGLLHQKLYQGENLAAIEMKDYFHNLAGSLLETYEAEDRIKVNVVMEPLELDVDTAVPLGLIVNELLTNAIKYAFEGGAAGAVEVGLSKEGAGYLLKVTDNGAGKDLDVPATGTGFGTRLVKLLSRQLGGTLTEVNDGGLKTELRFGAQS